MSRKTGLKNNLKVEVDANKIYKIEGKLIRNKRTEFIGKLLQKTSDHITFINKNKMRESFLIKDFFIGEYRIKEIA